MKGVNEQFGLKTDPQAAKLIKDAQNKANSAKIEVDFYSTPFEFTSVDPKSANHLFGNGKWKKQCVSAFGNDTFNELSEKYVSGNSSRSVDFKIAAFNTKQASYFAPNEVVRITDDHGHYTCEAKVLQVENKTHVIVMVPYTCNSRGKILNVTRMSGAEKAFSRFSQMIEDMSPSPVKPEEPVREEVILTETTPDPDKKTVSEPVQQVAVEQKENRTEPSASDEKDSVAKRKALLAGSLVFLLALAIVIAIVQHAKKNKKS